VNPDKVSESILLLQFPAAQLKGLFSQTSFLLLLLPYICCILLHFTFISCYKLMQACKDYDSACWLCL